MLSDTLREAPTPFIHGEAVRRGPWPRLLAQVLLLASGEAELVSHAERPWASVTFTGTRHTVSLAFVGAAAVAAGELFVAALPEHEFTMPRHLVADATITAVEHRQAPASHMTVEV